MDAPCAQSGALAPNISARALPTDANLQPCSAECKQLTLPAGDIFARISGNAHHVQLVLLGPGLAGEA
jgi:hypothetical protein